ncbi:MAG: polysaccharide biosynthesis tyrosine autokinase [Candidatus Electrothrix aestuarii]|uniref:non-specific protein-tyrosine kinase n=1 Tax=Candidatus Electrothrix aestuarii TaxID=3062594 RepID=A0AAU8LZS9_9BACT|nr:polysaccharide biosynthesis tyrosine autokinase [Candidatus Electrothrix aestuarii]
MTQPAIQEQEINLHQFLRILRRRYPYLIAIMLVIVLLAGVRSFRAIPLYKGSTLLIFEKKNNAPVDFATITQDGANESLATQEKIITSRKVIARVLDAINAEKLPQQEKKFLQDSGFKLSNFIKSIKKAVGFPEKKIVPDPIQRFRRKIAITSLRSTNLMQIQVTDPDPEKAALYANTLARIYIEYNLEDRRAASGNAFTWLSEQVAVLKAKVQKSEMDLLKYKQEESLTSLEKRQNTVDDKITELNENLSALVLDRMEKMAILQEIRGMADKLHKIDSIPEIMENSQIKLLKEEYSRLEIEFARISTKFKKNHPERIRLSTQLSHIKKRITAEAGKVVKDLEIGIHILQKKEETLAQSLDSYKKQARRIAEQAIEYGVLKREAESNKQMYKVLLERLKETDIGSSIIANNIRIVDLAKIPQRPFTPNIRRDMMLAGILGLFLGGGVCFLIEYFDNTIKGRDDLELLLGVDFIGAVPEKKHSLTLGGPIDKIVSRGHHETMSLLEFYRENHLLKTLMVTSTVAGEGKTTTAAGLALIYARAGKKVLLVDADIFKPRLCKVLGCPERPGLFDYFYKDTLPENLIQQTDEENLFILPCGLIPSNPTEIISSQKMRELLNSLGNDFDLLLIDSAPVTASSGISILASHLDGVALIIQAHSTNYHQVISVLKGLKKVRANVVGGILTRTNKKDGYGYGYGYGEGRKRQQLEISEELTS